MQSALDSLLKSQPALWRGSDRYQNEASIPTGFASLDKALPARGWNMGGVTEMLINEHGIGEVSILLPALSRLTRTGQWVALVNPPYLPYAPALNNAGIELDQVLIVSSDNDTDTLWASEQLLRAGSFASVITWVDKSNAKKQRRLQLAAESGKSLSVVYRPIQAASEHSPVSARLTFDIINSQLVINIIKIRGGKEQSVVIDPSEFDASQGVEWPISS